MASGTESNLYCTRGRSSGKKLGKETSNTAASSPKLSEEEVNEEEYEYMDVTSDDDLDDDALPKTGIMNGNPYFISTVTMKNDLYVPRKFIKDCGSKLGGVINIRDPRGKTTSVNDALWSTDRTYLQGWSIIYKLNHMRVGDKFVCELVHGNGSTETYIQLHTDLLKFSNLRELTYEQGKEPSSPVASSPKLPGDEVEEEEHEFMDITSDDDVDDNLPKTGIMNGNPYFVSTVKKKNELYVTKKFMKDYGGKLGGVINIRDPRGITTSVNVASWKVVGGTYLQGWSIIYKLNDMREGDKFLCELVQGNDTTETYIQLHTDLHKISNQRKLTSGKDLKTITRAHASSNVSYSDDMDARKPVIKKHKGHSSDLLTPQGSIKKSKVQNTHEQEVGFTPISPISSAVSCEDGLVYTSGYKVKATTAPILEAIFAKYGDITTNCSYKSLSIKTSLLEVLCNTIRKLRCTDIEAVVANLEVLETEISDVEASKIEVAWLREYLEKLRKVAASCEKSLQLREDKVTSGIATSLASKELQQRRAELAEAFERYNEAEKLQTAMKLVSQNIEDKIMCLKAEILSSRTTE